ncbi:dihydrofolate reductase family protein [Mycobacterium sp. SMC-4]|uniref:dihydrofolate reductase family protein n=1 Tax=Mycobacterium sp. SMC-4 TaxID=2857059 RepID=UPI003D0764DF
MGTLSYSTTVSLDGYVADEDGDFQWSTPSEEQFAVHVDRMAEVAVEVLGRKTFELMQYWETYDDEDGSAAEREFARRWQGIDKVVVSSTLTHDDLGSARARIVRQLSLTGLQEIVAAASGVVEIFGPTTAAEALRAGLVDHIELFVVPKIVGGGLRALPEGLQLDLRLVEHRVFADGTVHVRYSNS